MDYRVVKSQDLAKAYDCLNKLLSLSSNADLSTLVIMVLEHMIEDVEEEMKVREMIVPKRIDSGRPKDDNDKV